MKKRLISALLLIAMMISLLSFGSMSAAAATIAPTITVDGVTGRPGDTVTVPVRIANNPGILGAKFTFTFDEGLTLTKAESGDAFSALQMTKPGSFTSPCSFTWDAMEIAEEDIKDGVILTLTFDVSDYETIPETPLSIAVSYAANGIRDLKLNPVTANLVNGGVTVVDYVCGDLNEDGDVDISDVILLRRYLAGGYGIDVNIKAADTYLDGIVDITDVITLRRYLAGGYGIESLPVIPKEEHTHSLTATAAKDATCMEEGNIAYWYCSGCGKYFSDAEGKTEITAASTVIPKLESKEYTIQYMNELVPSTNTDYYLQNEITDHFHYTAGTEKALPTPKLDKYTFIGWSDAEGKLVGGNGKILPKSTTGDIVLYANWVSNRNKAKPVKELGKPNIFEDPEDNLIIFVYKIGTIENIPLYTTLNLQCVNGIITTVSETEQTAIKKSNATSVADTIENITTGSSSWTLSEDWNKTTEISKNNTYTSVEEQTRLQELSKHNGTSYSIGSSYSARESVMDSSGSVVNTSNNNSHVDYSEKDKNRSLELSVDSKLSNTTELSLGASVGAKLPSVATAALTGIPADIEGSASIGFKNTTNFEISGGADFKTSTREFESNTDSWSSSIDTTNETAHVETAEKAWNSSNSFTTSSDVSSSEAISRAISQGLSTSAGLTEGTTIGGGKTTSEEFGSSQKSGRTTGSVVTYDCETIKTVTHSFQSTGNTFGSYRMVTAGTAEVYAVIVYDMVKAEYSMYTYNVAKKETKEYLDYSAVDDNFDDYEYSIIPFEVPSEVNDYVNGRVLQTSGLELNPATGIVTGYQPYDGENPDTIIVIPTYWRYFDTKDNKYHIVEVKGIAADLFKGHDEIVGVQLGKGITEIPESAFEGCSSLKGIYCPGVTKIGKNAFKGCTSLESFTIPYEITSVGYNAFEGVQNVIAYAVNEEVEKSVIASGAKKISLNISKLADVKNISINIGDETDLFELNGVGKTFDGLTVVSAAKKTVLNGINITGETYTPLKTTSEILVLDHVCIDSEGISVVLGNPDTHIIVNNQNEIHSRCAKAIICRNVLLEKMQTNIAGTIELTGDILSCGAITGEKYLSFASGKIVAITETEYENYKKGMVRVTFDANQGTVSATQADVVYGMAYGDKLPATASRVGYKFTGWFTEKESGTQVTSATVVEQTTDITLYAHWSPLSYTVSFNVNATGATVSPSSITVTYDNSYGTLPTPTLAGTTFVGWYTAATGGDKVLAGTKVKITANQTLYAHWSRNSYSVSYNVNGGKALSTSSKSVVYGDAYGTLPTPTRDYYTFDGWYTTATGGTKVTSATIVAQTMNHTLYAHWTPNTYVLSYNVNGGNALSPGSKNVVYGNAYGTLPTPTRDYYTFNGWYTAASGGTKVTASTVLTGMGNTTIYAQWTLNSVSGWVKASSVPSGAQIVSTKWEYTQRETESSSSSSMSGWTLYDTQRTSWSSWSDWSTTDPTNGIRNVGRQSVYDHTEYHYYRWRNSSYTAVYAQKTVNDNYSCTILEEKWFDYELPVWNSGTYGQSIRVEQGYSSWKYVWVKATCDYNDSVDKTWTRDINRTEFRYQEPIYTYYFERYVSKSITSGDPTGQPGVSNVVKYVQYRAK